MSHESLSPDGTDTTRNPLFHGSEDDHDQPALGEYSAASVSEAAVMSPTRAEGQDGPPEPQSEQTWSYGTNEAHPLYLMEGTELLSYVRSRGCEADAQQRIASAVQNGAEWVELLTTLSMADVKELMNQELHITSLVVISKLIADARRAREAAYDLTHTEQGRATPVKAHNAEQVPAEPDQQQSTGYYQTQAGPLHASCAVACSALFC